MMGLTVCWKFPWKPKTGEVTMNDDCQVSGTNASALFTLKIHRVEHLLGHVTI